MSNLITYFKKNLSSESSRMEFDLPFEFRNVENKGFINPPAGSF
ncbi:hypothetical protein Pan110_45940 [Gimesia panareensis]|nr:hypothetical protein Pan110_45940 [Gimesia panareensis]